MSLSTETQASPNSCLPEELKNEQIPTASITTSTSKTSDVRPTSSVFARNEETPIHNVPMRVIRRPLPSELDENKVLTFMAEMKVSLNTVLVLLESLMKLTKGDVFDKKLYKLINFVFSIFSGRR